MVQVQSKSGAGTLDPGFGEMGKVSLPLPDIVGNIPGAILALRENKTLVAIRSLRPENTPAQLVRLYEDGTIDRTFGDNGLVKVPLEGDDLFLPYSLLPLADDGWLIAGWALREGEVRDLAVVRQDQNGKMDDTFGRGGVVTISIEDLLGIQAGEGAKFVSRRDDEKTDEKFTTTPSFSGFSVSAQQNGKIVLVSTIYFGPGSYRGIVLRLKSNGSLDLNFDGRGYLLVQLPGYTKAANFANGVAVDPDGNVLVCGDLNHRDHFAKAAYVIRYDKYGAVDRTFGVSENGLVIIAYDDRWPILISMALKPDGGIIAVGGTLEYVEMPGEGLIVVLDAYGRFNSDFNGGQPLFFDDLEFSGWGRCLLQSDGKIIVSGQGVSHGFINRAAVVARFFSDGRKDQTFANDGLVVIDNEGVTGSVLGITLRADNRIVLGYTVTSLTQAAVMCYFG